MSSEKKENYLNSNNDNSDSENDEKVNIRHLVLSGGGPAGMVTYGALKYLNEVGFWKLENIDTMYGCSIGGCIAFILSLGYEWEWLDDYFIKRPWTNVLKTHANTIFDCFYDKGFLDEKIIRDIMQPLLHGKSLDLNITLEELYKWNKKEIHVYTTNINKKRFEKVDISYKTHPDLSIIKAINMTTAYPIAFKPVCMNDGCFIDGGLLNNFPLNDCIEQTKCKLNEILAFKNIFITKETIITNDSTMFDLTNVIIRKMQSEINTESKQRKIKYTVKCIIENMNGFDEWIEAMNTESSRLNLIEKGKLQAELFISYVDYKNDII